jgi:hypothetical protein
MTAIGNGSSEVTIRSPHNSVYTIIRNAKRFDDLQGHWAWADVELLANKGIVNGQTANLYNPEQPVTRAEFAAMIVRSLGLLEQKSSSFTDVPSGAWFAGAIGTAKQYGLIDGFEDGTFRPQDTITREQMAVITVRAMKVGGKELPLQQGQTPVFADNADIGEWSREAVGRLAATNLIQGTADRTFAPGKDTTRAEAASLLKRVLQNLNFIN